MLANRSHVIYEFTNTKKLAKKLARIEASSICRQQFANLFADCFCAVHTHQLEFANTSLPTLVCRVKAALLCRLSYKVAQRKSVTILDGESRRRESKGTFICNRGRPRSKVLEPARTYDNYNFVTFRTDCAMLTSYIRADPRVWRVLAWML